MAKCAPNGDHAPYHTNCSWNWRRWTELAIEFFFSACRWRPREALQLLRVIVLQYFINYRLCAGGQIIIIITLLLKFVRIELIGCKTRTEGTALESNLYQLVNSKTSSSCSMTFNNMSNSLANIWLGIGRCPYFCPRNTYKNKQNPNTFSW